MQGEIKPVDRTDQFSPQEHGEFFEEMRGPIGGQTKGQAEKNDRAPGQLIKKFLHIHIISLTRISTTHGLRPSGLN